ncbi:hypothetical protein BpHYR1_034575 [Brachionus plicatilis]|uniref:Uncharacterized protein n=1 Tax=Brachionus plicatilis TaxID=10195 RepID=A0A3M7R7T8_BRAPC|nr:hypothetical protein BpHYR1_034575 [Brachionus plicatilis]
MKLFLYRNVLFTELERRRSVLNYFNIVTARLKNWRPDRQRKFQNTFSYNSIQAREQLERSRNCDDMDFGSSDEEINNGNEINKECQPKINLFNSSDDENQDYNEKLMRKMDINGNEYNTKFLMIFDLTNVDMILKYKNENDKSNEPDPLYSLVHFDTKINPFKFFFQCRVKNDTSVIYGNIDTSNDNLKGFKPKLVLLMQHGATYIVGLNAKAYQTLQI